MIKNFSDSNVSNGLEEGKTVTGLQIKRYLFQ